MDEKFVAPNNLEAEKNLLGALIIDKDAISEVADIVEADDFYSNIHGMIFAVILELFEKRQPTDIINITNLLEEKEQLAVIGGRGFLIDLAEKTMTSANCTSYAKIISKKSTLRRLISASYEINEIAHNQEEEIEDILDDAEQKLFAVAKNLNANSFTSLRSILNDSFERIDHLSQHKDQLRGVPSGFTELDNLLAGFQKSDLIILAARPSVGKTSFALDLVRNAALKSGLPVAFFSLEMSKEQLTDKLICAEARVDLWKLRRGLLSDDVNNNDYEKIGAAINSLSEANIFIDDSGTVNVMQIRTKCRRLKTEHGLGMIVIDYMQLIQDRGSDNRNNEISLISRSLKGLAKELDVPIIALSQLSRAVELSKPAIPKLAHLRESGSIEQDADIVMFIYRKSADRNYKPEEITPDQKNLAEIHIAKHRNGPTGVVNLFWDTSTTSFKNLAKGFVAPPSSIDL